ncbi:XRE family transcriptional regulator [Nocardia farcinica]|uniref:helix-turn-helix domain-containing protein n=1 Tax=Nocardia farcinica TaxID=37329 RepID=UPI0018930615|nr:XRE family transcriptional regulator [Nocardia farcinica]MBF6142893.1 XRE family transcriptional regulator [Nocardia farcinica]
MTTNWDAEVARRVGQAVRHLREAEQPKLSAAKLAQRTADSGYALTKAQISDLELGRKKTVTVPELLVLASALNVWPAWLLFPDLPDGKVEALPGHHVRSIDAADWLSGLHWLSPAWTHPGPDGEEPDVPETFDLLTASRMLRDLDSELRSLRVKAIVEIRRNPDGSDEIERRYRENADELTARRDDLAAAIRQHGGVVGEVRAELPTVPRTRRSDA